MELRGVETHGEGAETSLKNINLKIFPGEIVGVAGVSGNGQKELGDLVLGMVSCAEGEKLLFGKETTNSPSGKFAGKGLLLFPRTHWLWLLCPG